jgi:hypothetical protein
VNRRKSPIDEVPAFPIKANPEYTTVKTLTYEGNFIQERGRMRKRKPRAVGPRRPEDSRTKGITEIGTGM